MTAIARKRAYYCPDDDAFVDKSPCPVCGSDQAVPCEGWRAGGDMRLNEAKERGERLVAMLTAALKGGVG